MGLFKAQARVGIIIVSVLGAVIPNLSYGEIQTTCTRINERGWDGMYRPAHRCFTKEVTRTPYTRCIQKSDGRVMCRTFNRPTVQNYRGSYVRRTPVSP